MPSVEEEMNREEGRDQVDHEPEQEVEAEEEGVDILEILKRPTGEGEVEAYLDHPLNFNGSYSMARILRGLTGMLGQDLKLAVIDLTVGTYQFIQERMSGGESDVRGESS